MVILWWRDPVTGIPFFLAMAVCGLPGVVLVEAVESVIGYLEENLEIEIGTI